MSTLRTYHVGMVCKELVIGNKILEFKARNGNEILRNTQQKLLPLMYPCSRSTKAERCPFLVGSRGG